MKREPSTSRLLNESFPTGRTRGESDVIDAVWEAVWLAAVNDHKAGIAVADPKGIGSPEMIPANLGNSAAATQVSLVSIRNCRYMPKERIQ